MRARLCIDATVAALAGAVAAGIGFAAPLAPQLFAQRTGVPVDVELVLAVDVSYSMDPEEQELQREGYIAAITSPISASVARKIGERALRKLHRALIANGITEDVIRDYFRMKDRREIENRDNLAAILPSPTRTRDDASNHGIQRSRYLVGHPHAVAAGGHEPALAQIREMARDGRLRESKAVVEVADAHLVVPEKGEDPQTRLVGKCLEHVLQLVDGGSGFGR